MELSQAALACLYWYSFLFGAGAGLCYDLLGASRTFFGFRSRSGVTERLQNVKWYWLSPQRIPRGGRVGRAVLLFVQDFFFCLFTAVGMILLFYERNNGKIRIPALLFAVAGFTAFRLTAGKLLSFVLEAAIFFAVLVMRYVTFFVTRPFLWIGKAVTTAIRSLHRRRMLCHWSRQRKRLTERLLSGGEEAGHLLATMEQYPEWGKTTAIPTAKEQRQRELYYEKSGKETVQHGAGIPDPHRRRRPHRRGRVPAGRHAL